MTARIARPSARAPGHLAMLWQHRELVRNLVLRNLKVKYQRSVLGFSWTLLNPLLTVAVLVVVFRTIVRIPIPQYWAFLLSGYFVWNFLQQVLYAGTYTLAEHADLSRSVPLPSEVLIMSATLSRLVEFAAELALVVVALALARHGGVPASFALLPVLVMLQFALALGLGLLIATLSAFYNDVQHALPIALTTLFYLSPVFYSVSLIPERWRGLYLMNPVAALLTLYHTVLYEGRIPPPPLLAGAAVAVALTIAAGYAIFNRYKSLFAEIV